MIYVPSHVLMPGKKENLRTNKQKNNTSLPDSRKAGSKKADPKAVSTEGKFHRNGRFITSFSQETESQGKEGDKSLLTLFGRAVEL